MLKGKVIFYVIAAVVFVMSGFTYFEFRVNGSAIGRLWQLVHGNKVDYGGLRITLPPYWLAIHPSDDIMLIHFAGDHTAEVSVMATLLNDPAKWEQFRPTWIASRIAKFEEEGYESTTIPTISAFGKPTSCLGFVPKNNKGKREIVCAIADGNLLVAFSGPESDVPSLIAIMGSVRPLSPKQK